MSRGPFFSVRLFKKIVFLFFAPTFAFLTLFALSAGYFWNWHLNEILSFYISIGLGLFVFITFSSYLFTKQFGFLLKRTYRISSKFRFWMHDTDEIMPQEDEDLFLEMDRALARVRSKLLVSRKKLAHELEQGKTLMRHLQDAVIAITVKGDCLFFNSAFATIFLDQERVSLFRKKLLRFEQILRQPDLLSKIDLAIKTRSTVQLELELPLILTESHHDFNIKISPLFEEKDQKLIYGVMILFHDMTEYKKAEKLRLQFVENASHELRTPLTSVKGYLDLAIQDLTQKQYEHLPSLLTTTSAGVDRLVALVNDLLDLSKNDKSNDLQLDWVYPLELTDRVLQILSPLAQQKNMMIKMSSNVDMIKIDELKFEQILVNLVANAIKYNPSQTQIEIRWVLMEDQAYKLEVEDNGVGIPHQHWDRLFERFYRIEESRDSRLGGTGLGLAIVKQVVEAHQGRIGVVPTLTGIGTCFRIELPRVKFPDIS